MSLIDYAGIGIVYLFFDIPLIRPVRDGPVLSKVFGSMHARVISKGA